MVEQPDAMRFLGYDDARGEQQLFRDQAADLSSSGIYQSLREDSGEP